MLDPRVRAQCEALLLQPLFEPVAQAFGEYGSLAQDAFAQALARVMERADERA